MSNQIVPLGDLQRQYRDLRPPIDAAVARVLASGNFILGEETRQFELEWAAACQTRFAVGCANGTDAITLALLSLGLEPGAEVVVPAMTAVPTATGVLQSGLRPIYADVDAESGLITAETVERILTPSTRAVIAVHLYGQSCAMNELSALSRRRGLKLIEDAAQAHGATDQGRPLGASSDAVTFSFYPSKNLGAYGDGGALATNNVGLAERSARARNYGQFGRYDHREYGINSRLDELQAAILRVKVPHLPAWNSRRRLIAEKYDAALAKTLVRPLRNHQGEGHVHHLYVVRTAQRERVAKLLSEAGVATSVHYPRALPEQPGLPKTTGEWRVAAQLASEILTIPLFPELRDEEVERVCGALKSLAALQ